ncbi:GNAT family N-acetyltransferase [Pseudoduganella umbonata]|uniref:GNAT family N-acetyltransferase n=1 Tax=Pseudoduganella umbonata TaxID=864828 RepID=A0A4P8HTZ7_9BURK|nr:GNAT family N-acetyltransferase [Pseudoduganella umbonata]MBB3220640.1 GNAT superfamily N-acetyltransferase [Pseudoduganella umbonata]QCP11865.1 GNAT family N-acetyltransferase [Pseudoduganella umbonata]
MEFTVDTDKARLDVARIHRYLGEESTWALGIPRETVDRAIAHSLCFGGYVGGAQAAFARVVTDQATFAYLLDVFVLPEYQGRGYGTRLMDAVMAHPGLQGLRKFMLTTTTAAPLYARYGFTPPAMPEALMERAFADMYRQPRDR